MTAARVRWEHIQRIYALCGSATATASMLFGNEEAPPDVVGIDRSPCRS
jgi:hypothetical protein